MTHIEEIQELAGVLERHPCEVSVEFAKELADALEHVGLLHNFTDRLEFLAICHKLFPQRITVD